VAHVLEHMMFKGTRTVPGGEFSRLVAAAGGRENAFTSRDFTGYHQQLHKSKLELAFRLEADRMANLVITKEEFDKEIRVVMEERRLRTDDQPHGVLNERLMAAVFSTHPYGRPVIGWMSDLENMTHLDALEWYRRWYAPNNATLVVAGDVAAAEVFALAERHFGALEAKVLPVRKPQDEPPQRGIRRLVVKAPAELPALTMAWRAPVLRDVETEWEPYALEMLAGVLDGSDAARLNSRLVREEKIANAAGASYESTQRGPGLFVVNGVPAAGRTVGELEAALRRELEKIAVEGVGEDELRRVRAQVIASQVFERDSIFYQGMQIGILETAGYPHRTIDVMLKRLQQVTAAQVQAVARKFLVDDSLTVAVLDPQPVEGRRREPSAPGVRHGQ
jgi:zinc protease